MTMTATRNAARITVIGLFLFVATVQLGIALSLLNPNITWKASFDRWSWKLCFLSLFAAVILTGWAILIYNRPNRWVYIITALYMALNTAGNLTSENDFERYGFGAITFIIAACSAFLACTEPRNPADYADIGSAEDKDVPVELLSE